MDNKVNILISTINAEIQQLDQVILPKRRDVEYIVSHQYTDEKFKTVPAFLKRDDIRVSKQKGKGVTKSRNTAIRLADGDIGLFADDDVTYKESYIDTLKQVFKEHKDLDIALFKINTGSGQPEYKKYAEKAFTVQKAPSVGTVEIGFRIQRVKDKGIHFDERFGAGQPLLIGSDEKLFVQDCIDAGLRVKFFPEYIVNHDYESTVKKIPKYDKRLIWVTGGVDCRMNGPVALLKAFFGTLKILPELIKNRVNPFAYFYHRISAVIYILKTNRDHYGN